MTPATPSSPTAEQIADEVIRAVSAALINAGHVIHPQQKYQEFCADLRSLDVWQRLANLAAVGDDERTVRVAATLQAAVGAKYDLRDKDTGVLVVKLEVAADNLDALQQIGPGVVTLVGMRGDAQAELRYDEGE